MVEEDGPTEVVAAVVNGTATPAKVGENLSEKKEEKKDGSEGMDIDSKVKTQKMDVDKGDVKVRHSKKNKKEVKEEEKKVKKVKKDSKEKVKENDVTESDKIEVVSGGEVEERNKNKDEKVAEKVSKKRSRKKSAGEQDTAQKNAVEEKKEKEKEKKKEKEKEKKEEQKTPVASVLDRPVRQRKSVQRLVAVLDADTSKEFHIDKGRGTSLKDIPNVAYKLSRRKLDETLKMLHTILFGRRGKAVQIKNNILQFSGYVWIHNEEKQRLKVREKLDKYTKENLLEFCDLLDLQIPKATAKKEEIIAKLIEFLESPHATTSELLAEKEQSSKGKRRRRAGKSTASMSDDSVTKASSKSKKRKISSEDDKKKNKPEGGDGTEEEKQQEDGEEENENENVKGSPEKSKDEKPDESESEEENESGTGSEEDEPEKSSKNSSSKKEPTEKPKTKKTLTPKKPQKSNSLKPSSSSKVLDDTQTGPKTFSRKKKNEVGTEKSSAPKKSASKEKSALKEKSGKKVVKAKEKSKEDKPRPSDDDLRTAVCEILKEVDFNTATFTDILNLLGERFKTDLTPRKASIKLIIQDELTKLSEEADNKDDEDDEDDAEKDEKQPSGEA